MGARKGDYNHQGTNLKKTRREMLWRLNRRRDNYRAQLFLLCKSHAIKGLFFIRGFVKLNIDRKNVFTTLGVVLKYLSFLFNLSFIDPMRFLKKYSLAGRDGTLGCSLH